MERFPGIIRKQKTLFLITIIFIALVKVFSTLPAILIGRIIDKINASDGLSDYHFLINDLLLFAAVGVVSALASPLQIVFLTRFVQNTICLFSIKWITELFRKEFAIFDALNIGKVIKLIERGILAYEKIITYMFSTLLPLMIELLILTIWLIKTADLFFMMMLVVVSAIYFMVVHFIIKFRRIKIDLLNDVEDEQMGALSHTLLAAKNIKLEQAYDTALRPLYQQLIKYAQQATRVSFSGALLLSAKIVFITLSTIIIIVYGLANSYAYSRMSIGEFVSLFTLSTMLLNDIVSLAESWRVTDQFMSDKKNFESLLSQKRFKENQTQTIDSENTSETMIIKPFNYLSNGQSILLVEQEIVIKQKDKIAIIGPSGSGKTTLLELATGMCKCDGTSPIVLNGVALDALTENEHLTTIRYVPQQPRFTVGHIGDAVFFGRPYPENIRDYFISMDIGYLWDNNKYIDHDASGISGGEARKLSIMRLISRPGKFNFFDEPTSSVDGPGASKIWALIMTRLRDAAVICTTHDCSILDKFDRIIVINRGRVIASGAWQEISSMPQVKKTVSLINAEQPGT